MPVGFTVTRYFTLKNQKTSLNPNEKQRVCFSEFAEKAEVFSRSGKIIGYKMLQSDSEKTEAQFTAYENIGRLTQFRISETNESGTEQ